MKKLFTVLMLLSLGLILSACGPNSMYYNLNSVDVYYYENQTFEFNPLDYLSTADTKDKEFNKTKTKVLNNVNNYDIEVLYKLENSKGDYQSFKVDPDGVIRIEDPMKDLKNGFKYDVKFHFVDRKTKSTDEMLNMIGVFSFKLSPVNKASDSVTAKANTEFNLLSNLKVADGSIVNESTYEVEYIIYNASDEKVVYLSTDDQTGITAYTFPTDLIEYNAKGGKSITFKTEGTYHVNVVLIEKASGADDTASATPSAGSATPMTLVFNYDVTVAAAE